MATDTLQRTQLIVRCLQKVIPSDLRGIGLRNRLKANCVHCSDAVA